MSWLKLQNVIGTNYRVDPNDLMNTKRVLNQLGYYNIPAHRGIDDWTDDTMFDGIRRFQRDHGLKVDGLMRPGGPTEQALNQRMGGGASIDTSGLFDQFRRYAPSYGDDFAEAKPPWKPRPPNPGDPGCRASGTCDISM